MNIQIINNILTDFISLTEEEKKIVIQLISSETKDQVKSSKSEVDRLKKYIEEKVTNNPPQQHPWVRDIKDWNGLINNPPTIPKAPPHLLQIMYSS